MIDRPAYQTLIEQAFKTHKVVAMLGLRQCGKTTLARTYVASRWAGRAHFFDLEDPADLAILEHPKTALEPLEGLIIIDEIQRIPELFIGGCGFIL